jgi:hypothetical protein
MHETIHRRHILKRKERPARNAPPTLRYRVNIGLRGNANGLGFGQPG